MHYRLGCPWFGYGCLGLELGVSGLGLKLVQPETFNPVGSSWLSCGGLRSIEFNSFGADRLWIEGDSNILFSCRGS